MPDRKLTTIDARMAEALAPTGTHLTDIVGGPVTAATILGELGDVTRASTSGSQRPC